MLRITAEGLLLFLTPFAVYALMLVVAPRVSWLRGERFGDTSLRLALCGVGLLILALCAWTLVGERQRGAYEPAHVEDGRIVPGRIQ